MPYDLLGADDILAGLDVLGDDDMSGLSDILAGDDYSGDELGTLLSGAIIAGAQPSGAAAAHAYLAKQQAKKQLAIKGATRELAMRNAQAVVPRDYTRGRKLVIGIGTDPQDVATLGPSMVAVGASKTFQVQPQIPFKPDRFWVASLSAANFVVTDIKVGQQSMFAASSAVPAQMFAENSVDSPVNFDTAQISQQLIASCVNVGTAVSPFFGSFRGFSAL